VKQVITQRCELGHDHVQVERIFCNLCHGLINEAAPRTVNWFGTGVYSEISEYAPSGAGGRDPITVLYSPVAAAGRTFELHFCCVSHVFEFFSTLPAGSMAGDRVVIQMHVFAFEQTAIVDLPRG